MDELNLWRINHTILECSKFKFHEVITRIASVQVSSNNWVILYRWIRVLQLMIYLGEPCFVTCFEHQVVRDVEDVERCIRSFVNEKFERLKIFWCIISLLISVHSGPKIFIRDINVCKISNEHITTIFDAFFALS